MTLEGSALRVGLQLLKQTGFRSAKLEVWWAKLDKKRPVVLVSRQEAYAVRALVIVAAISTTIRGHAVEIKLGRAEGLPKGCVVNCDWLVTVPKTDLLERAGVLTAPKLQLLDKALTFALGLEG